VNSCCCWKSARCRILRGASGGGSGFPPSVRMAALKKAWKNRHWWEKPGQERVRVTPDEWIVIHFGRLLEEREQLIQYLVSRGKGHYSRCRNCGRGVVSNGPYDRCAACGSPHGDPQLEGAAEVPELRIGNQ